MGLGLWDLTFGFGNLKVLGLGLHHSAFIIHNSAMQHALFWLDYQKASA
jgi:hypothetical protein